MSDCSSSTDSSDDSADEISDESYSYRSDEETMSVWVLNYMFGLWQNLNPTRGRDFPFQRSTYPINVLGYKYCMYSLIEITVVIENVVIVGFEEMLWIYSKAVSVCYTFIPCGFLLELEDYYSTFFSTVYSKGIIQI